MDRAIQELYDLREDLIRQIDSGFNQIIKSLKDNSDNVVESLYPLRAGTAVFKGKRPVAIILPNGVRKDCSTWKKVVQEILMDCCSDSDRHQKLKDLTNKIQGKKRVLLGSDSSNMCHPLKVDDDLFMETHYDAETLLNILTVRILDVVGYDYSGIQIVVQSKV